MESENAERALLPEHARPMQPSADERMDFVMEYVGMLQSKLQLTQAQRDRALSLTPVQLDVIDALVQTIQIEQPTAMFREGRNVPDTFIRLIKRFLDNPPSDETLQMVQAMFGKGLVFLSHGLSDVQIRDLLLTPEDQPTDYAREVAHERAIHDSFILEITPEGAAVYKRHTKSGHDASNWDSAHPMHEWSRFVLPLPEQFVENLPKNVVRLRR